MVIGWTLAVCLPGTARAQPPEEEKFNVANPLPPQTPPWLEGFQVRWPIRVIGDPGEQKAQSILVQLPTGGWLKPDAADLAVQSATGKLLPLAVLSHDPNGDTIIQFKREGDNAWYWVYGINPKGTGGPRADPKTDAAFREGITLEVREWAGDSLDSWAKVRAGLEMSNKVLDNAIVTEVVQVCNPARPADSNRFAVSYRGYFNAKKEGSYRFVVNADDAAFLFVDGFKVFERPGVQAAQGQLKVKELNKISGNVDLKPGVHAFEVHQAVGDRPQTQGICALVWMPPGEPKYNFLTSLDAVHPLYARVAALEKQGGESAGLFAFGLDDTLDVIGLKLFLVRFEALGPATDDKEFVWDFGDGTTGQGRSIVHPYFKEGDYQVTLKTASGLPPYRQRVNVWPEPGDTSPLSLGLAIKALEAIEWRKLDREQIRKLFTFLNQCEQPNRWPMLDAVVLHLLAQKDLDLDMKSQLYVARLEALTHLGKAVDALKLAAQVRPEFARTPALQVRIQLAEAAIHQYHYHDASAASRIYKDIIDKHSRVEHPSVRLAAIRWGDLFAETGDLVKADETYRLAATLGGQPAGATTTEASTRGALLRIAEQKLREGDVHATRQLLQRLEVDHPGRRLDGLYCFLHAESDRQAGRYEEALRHYEMIFKLPQWAGYKDRATLGIADTYLRMNDLDKALKWLGDLKENFPKYFESQKGADLEKLTLERKQRLAAGTKNAVRPFTGFATNFAPDEAEWHGSFLGPGNQYDVALVRAPAIYGSYAALLDTYPRLDVTNYNYTRPLKNLRPGGTYWVEYWYRDVIWPWNNPGQPASTQTYLIGEAPPKASAGGTQHWYRNAHHRWHKVGVKIKVAPALDFQVQIMPQLMVGAFLIDGIRVRPISDRQADALLTFQEGLKTP
jgi:tetratricopeptide (TPR) repeat protein